MSKIVGTLIFIAGTTIGAVTGALWAKKKCDDFYREELDDVTKTLRDTLKKNKETKEKIIEDAEGIGEVSAAVQAPEKTEKTQVRERYNKIVKKMNYNTVSTKEDREVEEEEKYEYSKLSNKGDSDVPFIITTEQFADEMEHYDKLTLYYYEDDDTLTEDNEEVIVDIYGVVGPEALTNFGTESDDPEVVYIRNDKMQIDYEVIRLSKSYKETVLGYTDEDGRGGRR